MTNENVLNQIKNELETNDVVLFMKGTAVFPQCGFSAVVVQVLSQMGLTFKAINVLEDDDIRQGIKDYAQWPTIPQLYIKGEFIGGADIIREMYSNGELEAMLNEKGVTFNKAA